MTTMISDTLITIAEETAGCETCPLYLPNEEVPGKRHLAVPGFGPAPADLLFVGEAPGLTESDRGLPFQGRSGDLLDKLLSLANIQRADIFVTNTVKHRPPKNRIPKVKELRACAPFLERQVALVRPKVVVTLGATAAKVFDKTIKLTNDHGRARRVEYHGQEFYLIPMYHPAAALRDAAVYAVLVEDFQRLPLEIGVCLAKTKTPPTNYQLMTEYQAASASLSADHIGFDLETTSPKKGEPWGVKSKYLDVQATEIVGWSTSWYDGEAAYVQGKPLDEMRGVLEAPSVVKVSHNTKFELGRLRALGINMHPWEDT